MLSYSIFSYTVVYAKWWCYMSGLYLLKALKTVTIIIITINIRNHPDQFHYHNHDKNYHLPTNMGKMRKAQKLGCPHDISEKVVGAFVFQ